MRAVRRPPWPTNSFIFLRNFNDFPPHTEVYPRLKFSESALCIGPPDPRIPSFSDGISMIFLPILRSSLGPNSARSRCAPAPLTHEFHHFPMEFQWFSSPYWGLRHLIHVINQLWKQQISCTHLGSYLPSNNLDSKNTVAVEPLHEEKKRNPSSRDTHSLTKNTDL